MSSSVGPHFGCSFLWARSTDRPHFPFVLRPISTKRPIFRAFAWCFGLIQSGVGSARDFVLDFRAGSASPPDQQAQYAEDNQDASRDHEPMPKPQRLE